ncbi:MAG: hypothetical protein ACOYEV_16435 [Candidatus Nanopelagicales bacterium]
MKALPTEDELWHTWEEFLTMYGAVTADPDIGVTVACEGQVSLFRLSKGALHLYVRDFVEWRREHGLSDGRGDGLPFGPQTAAYVELALDGRVAWPSARYNVVRSTSSSRATRALGTPEAIRSRAAWT